MRIYNSKNASLNFNYTGNQVITVGPKSLSGNVIANSQLITNIISAYGRDEVCFICSGAWELNLLANISGSVGYIVDSVEEAIERFAPKDIVEEDTSFPIIEDDTVVVEEDIVTPELITEEVIEKVIEDAEEADNTDNVSDEKVIEKFSVRSKKNKNKK